MRHLSTEELAQFVTVKMSKEQKLQHWAFLIRRSDKQMLLFSNLEYMREHQLQNLDIHRTFPGYDSPFRIACSDSIFQAEGLTAGTQLPEFMKFMELTQMELHEFSCDCGGQISTQGMADRIEHLAK